MDVILVADETKNIEIKAKVILKKMPRAEYEAIMMPYKRLMLQFERDLRKLADNGVISFSIVDKFTKEFNFADLQRLHFDSEEQDSYQQGRIQQQAPAQQFAQQPAQNFSFGQQQPATSRSFGLNQQQPQAQQASTQGFAQQPQNQTAQRPSSFSFGQSQPTPPPTSSFGFRNTEAPAFGGQSSSPRPGTAPPPSSFGRQESQSGMFGQSGSGSGSSGGISSFSDISKDKSSSSAPSFSPRSPPPSQPSFGLSDDFSSQSKPQEGKISVGIDEEDRATGIAILRKKMLMELRKIRNVVEQEDDSSF